MMRARLLAQLGRTEEAISDLQMLTGQQPENFEALITLASLYASADRWESVEALIPTIAARPQLQDVALYLEGRAALSKNRVGTARAKFEAAIEAIPKDADSLRRTLYFYRGVCLDKLKRYEEAEELILNAIDAGFRPETAEEVLLASRILLRAERHEDAIPLLEAITLNHITPSAEVWAMLGRAHLANDTTTLAISAFNKSLLINPEQSKTLALRGSLLRKIGDLEGALADYENAHRLIPSSPVISYERGLVLLQLSRIDDAEAFLHNAARTLSTHYTLDLLHATCAFAIGKNQEATESLLEYLTEIPADIEPSAIYLARFLPVDIQNDSDDPVLKYFDGNTDRKTVLDWAGTAKTPEQAQKKICAVAFWMAQHELACERKENARELLKIATEIGLSEQPEFQFASWQLRSIKD
jgi:tetratricopeptide (TPR) repeat protein